MIAMALRWLSGAAEREPDALGPVEPVPPPAPSPLPTPAPLGGALSSPRGLAEVVTDETLLCPICAEVFRYVR